MTATSLGMVNSGVGSVRKVLRSTLIPGDLYRVERQGRTLMHTGARTCPPSARSINVVTPAGTFPVEVHATIGRRPNGEDIIAFQSIVVDGDVKAGSDGAVVSFSNKNVYLVGRATINPVYSADA
jgi:hypothetical protein